MAEDNSLSNYKNGQLIDTYKEQERFKPATPDIDVDRIKKI